MDLDDLSYRELRKRRSRIRELARTLYHREGDLEIDGRAPISEGDDNGAYVMMWKWVPFDGTAMCKGRRGSHQNCRSGCPVFDSLVEPSKD